MQYFHSWSGGKDSTASIILDPIHGLPPAKIIFSEVMFESTGSAENCQSTSALYAVRQSRCLKAGDMKLK